MVVAKFQTLQSFPNKISSMLSKCYPNCNYSNITYFKRTTKAILPIKVYSMQENMVLVSTPVFIKFNLSPDKKSNLFQLLVEKLADL